MVIPIGCDFPWVDRMRASRDASRFRSMGLALAAQRPWGWGVQRRVCSARMRDAAALGAQIPHVDWSRLQFPLPRNARFWVAITLHGAKRRVFLTSMHAG